MSDLDDFFGDPEIGDEATVRIFKSNKNIFDLKYKFIKQLKKGIKKKKCRVPDNDKNILIGWFKERGRTLTADIAAEFFIRVFFDNSKNVCTKAIKDELIKEMRWNSVNCVISFQRGFVATLKPNKVWTEEWMHSKSYFTSWLSWMIKDMTEQLTIQMNNPLPGIKISRTTKGPKRNDKHIEYAAEIACILITNSVQKLAPSWDRLKIEKSTQSSNRRNNQKLSKWNSNTNFTDFLRKAVGLPSGTSSNQYKAKASRYGLLEDIFRTDEGKKIHRRNVLMCVACKRNGEFNEMVWPSQVCSVCKKSVAANLIERIRPDDSGRFKVPARVCKNCGIPPVKAKKKRTVRLKPSYLFVTERNGKAVAVQVTPESTLPLCTGGTIHNFPTGPGMPDTTVFIQYKEAERIVLKMLEKDTTQNDINAFFGNNTNNNSYIDNICKEYKAPTRPVATDSRTLIKHIGFILNSENCLSLYANCPDLENLDSLKSAMKGFFEFTLKSKPAEFDEKWLWLKNITTMNDALFNKFKGMMRSIFEWYEVYNESDISNKIAANNAFGIIKNDHSD